MRKMQTERIDVNHPVTYNRLPEHEERLRAHCAQVREEYHNQPIKTGVAISYMSYPNHRVSFWLYYPIAWLKFQYYTIKDLYQRR